MILAADFGGTSIKLGLVRDGSVLARSRLAARADRPMADRLEAVACEFEKLLQAKGSTLQNCTGVSLALPFLVEPKSQRVRGEFGKFPGASEIHFGEWSRARLNQPVALENDLRVALLGEWAAGAARGKDEVVMVAIGTGIGCAVIAGGRLLRGANNRAATLFGHSTVALGNSVGRCGNLGCAEDLAATATLAFRAQARPDFPGSKLAAAAKMDYETLFALAAQNDACSQTLLEQSLQTWAVVVQNAVIAYDPEVVVLGGGVLRQPDLILSAVANHLRQHMPDSPLSTAVLASALGDDAALIGGEVLVKQPTFL